MRRIDRLDSSIDARDLRLTEFAARQALARHKPRPRRQQSWLGRAIGRLRSSFAVEAEVMPVKVRADRWR